MRGYAKGAAQTHTSANNACSRLQTTALLAGEALPIPEIVAVGGQSDGKSTLLEALLGFRFNVREVRSCSFVERLGD